MTDSERRRVRDGAGGDGAKTDGRDKVMEGERRRERRLKPSLK